MRYLLMDNYIASAVFTSDLFISHAIFLPLPFTQTVMNIQFFLNLYYTIQQ